MLWLIGNTTVRNPYRLREALLALKNSSLNGNLVSQEKEYEFGKRLHEAGVLVSKKLDDIETTALLGRKWRSALYQLGFVTPRLTKKLAPNDLDSKLEAITSKAAGLTGKPFEITPNGRSLAQADTVAAQQECFLRSLAAYQIPSSIENGFKCKPFLPLIYVLKILIELGKKKELKSLSFNEFCYFVQTSQAGSLKEVLDKIVTYRKKRAASKGKLKEFERKFFQEVTRSIKQKPGTLKDYADTNFRYLKATGLFISSGRGIALSSTHEDLAQYLAGIQPQPDNALYLQSLWSGAKLPTDNLDTARSVVSGLAAKISQFDKTVSIPKNADLKTLTNLRHKYESLLLQHEEEQYAIRQEKCLDEILGWLQVIISRKSYKLSEDETLSIPVGDYPLYLEWVIWRAFLAINSLQNKPWQSRHFQIDQDFRPVSCAPGGRPDMVFEFEDYYLVVEVTLTNSSRQEAAEGEPVRRHVAFFAETQTKPVFGLFIALNIDSNTAHTFRLGDWYLKNDRKISLDIVPVSLSDFQKLLLARRSAIQKLSKEFQEILTKCRAKANQDAPQWKASIHTIMETHANK